jgi:hypothetical protein
MLFFSPIFKNQLNSKKNSFWFLILFLIISLSGCRWISDAGTPFFSMVNIKIPDGTPAFKQGFSDGCSMVVRARGNMLYRFRFKYRFDPKMIENSEYRFGHSRGASWCFQNVLSEATGPQKSFDNYLMPYGNWGYDSSVKSVGDMFDNIEGGAFNQSLTTPGPGLNSTIDVYQKGGSGSTGSAFGSNPFWAGGSKGHFFGWGYDGYNYGYDE